MHLKSYTDDSGANPGREAIRKETASDAAPDLNGAHAMQVQARHAYAYGFRCSTLTCR